ncbi:serine/threonine protein kinase [Paratractidigestivibacter sp.]|uniref:serine/threonine protein kinase n=1 Tax=Paratractidigestivibacter sp. TaxID=2847316 RepID=UPI002ACB180B|nr:protein kinase [Paratractidigestivibacter sp.]
MDAQTTDSIHDELAARLEAPEAAKAPGAYRVEEVLKVSAAETTQLVYLRVSGGGELGPYVRKLIQKDSGLGGVYRILYDAQSAGKRFRQLPRVVSIAEKDGMAEVLMEHVAGASLREVVESARAADRWALAGLLMPAVCGAVVELHEGFDVPVIHRDITPGNVICPEAEPATPVLIDLGIAREWQVDATADTTHFGTRAYAPPEQFGFGQTDVRSDVYALGMLAFFCLVARDPEPEDRAREFNRSQVNAVWRKVIAKACALDPEERYQSVRELRDALLEAARATADKAARNEADDDAAEPEPDAPLAKKTARLITPRNVIVLPIWALFTVMCVTLPFSPDTNMEDHPVFNIVGYLLWMPGLFTLIAYVLMNKRWLEENVAFFRDHTKGEAIALLGLAFSLLTVVWFVLAGLGR